MLQTQFGVPGQLSAVFSEENQFLWGGDVTRIPVLMKSCVIDGATREAGNSPTHVLRQGLILGKVTATGKLKQWDNAAADGSETVYGILPVELVMTNPLSGSSEDKVAPIVVFAPVKVNNIRIKGDAFVGHADEAACRTELNAKRFMLDDEY